MRALVATDFGIYNIDGHLYTRFALSSIIIRYKEHFGELVLCAPITHADIDSNQLEDITEIVESFIPINRDRAFLRLDKHRYDQILESCDLVIARLPSSIAIFIAERAYKKKKPVFSEVMGCTWDAMWNHGYLGKAVAVPMFLGMKNVVRKSDYALYVTEKFLQNRYPCSKKSVGVSDVVFNTISDEIIRNRFEKIKEMDRNNVTLMTSAAVNVRYKGQHYVIQSIPELNRRGIKVKYLCVGQGDNSYLKKVAKKYNVEEQVIFTGSVKHEDVFSLLDSCDIYIQPSLQEGLPRAMVEALSRGCPCVGARTGGIPELIPEQCIFKRKSVKEIAKKIEMLLNSNLMDYAESSFKRANDFSSEYLDKRRSEYLEYVKNEIEED